MNGLRIIIRLLSLVLKSSLNTDRTTPNKLEEVITLIRTHVSHFNIRIQHIRSRTSIFSTYIHYTLSTLSQMIASASSTPRLFLFHSPTTPRRLPVPSVTFHAKTSRHFFSSTLPNVNTLLHHEIFFDCARNRGRCRHADRGRRLLLEGHLQRNGYKS